MESRETDLFHQYQICLSALSILRYIVLYRNSAHASIPRRLVQKYDTVGLLVSLIESGPWTRVNTKLYRREIIHGSSWIQKSEHVMSVPEACVWIMLISLILNSDIDMRRITPLFNLRKYITEPMICQIPNLQDLRKYLEEVNLMHVMGKTPNSGSTSVSPFAIIEIGKTLYEQIKDTGGVLKYIQPLSRDEQIQAARILVEMYEDHRVDEESPEIASIGEACHVCRVTNATTRCSVCQKTVYCSRACQVKDWPNHKPTCN